MSVAALVVGIVAMANFADGNTGMGIAQVINLVSIVFSMFNPTCFTGDTEVYTDDGLVCIEDVQVGDEVWAYNPETGETELKEVLNIWIKETDEIMHASTSDGEIIDTTTNHPFYVEDKGWVAAGDLEIGDMLFWGAVMILQVPFCLMLCKKYISIKHIFLQHFMNIKIILDKPKVMCYNNCRWRQSKRAVGKSAGVAELADAPALGAGVPDVQVQVLSPAPQGS